MKKKKILSLTISISLIILVLFLYFNKSESNNLHNELVLIQDENYVNLGWLINHEEIDQIMVDNNKPYYDESLNLRLNYPKNWIVNKNNKKTECQNNNRCEEWNINFSDPSNRITLYFLFSEALNSSDGSLFTAESLNNYWLIEFNGNSIGIPIYPGNFLSISNDEIYCANIVSFDESKGLNLDGGKYLGQVKYVFQFNNFNSKMSICHNANVGNIDKKTIEELYSIIKSFYHLN